MGKKKRVSLLTEEERVAFEEQQRLLEEEMRKKKENVLSQFLRDKLMHEERATRYNMNKLDVEWRRIMKAAKTMELKKDFEILSQTFERVIDAKDAFIRTLINEIVESEEMYAMAVRSHLQVTDYLLDLQNERLDMITREYYQQLEMICEEFDIERGMLKEHHHTEMLSIDDILYAMEVLAVAEEKDVRADFEMMEVEIKNKTQEDRQALRLCLGTKIEELWQQFRNMLQTYNDINEEKRALFEILKQKDDKRSKEIDMNNRKLDRTDRLIRLLRAKIAARTKGYQTDENSVKDDEEDDAFNKLERMRLAHDYHVNKASILQVRIQNREKLVRLTVDSSGAIKQLRKQIEKGVSILKLAEICRKLETEEEKTVPFYLSSLSKQEEEESVKAAFVEPSPQLLTKAIEDCSGLNNFWKRYSKVLLDKVSLDKEKETLTAENDQLRRLLKQYMDSISVNDQVLRQNNPLLVVTSGVSSCTGAKICRHSCHRKSTGKTVVEAAHLARHLLN